MFNASDLANMRTTQQNHQMDTCVLQAVVETENSFNELVQTWPSDSSALTCGLDMKPGAERHGPDKTLLEWDAVLRLPITSTPGAKDRIKITKRFGETLSTPLVYEITGPIQRGPSGNRVLLQRVET